MRAVFTTKSICLLILAGTLAGCAGFGSDGSVHPDGTAGIAGYTGQGRDGEGWAGDSSGEGGPSAEQPAADDLTPR